jgi:hydroxypyruvate isomerase
MDFKSTFEVTAMNRREFSKTFAGAALGAAALCGSDSLSAGSPPAEGEGPGVPFKLSVMLWTVFTKLPFEERLAKVAEAGYKNVELVGEYRNWSDGDFKRALAKKRELGLTFDVTAGLAHGVADPGARDGLLADVRKELPIMERLDCPAVIVMSGNVVPGMPRAQQHESCVEGLKRAVAIVEGKKIAGQPVRLLLENIDPEENPKYYLQSVAEGFEVVRAVNHPQVQFLYDFFHEQIAEGNLIEKLEKNIAHVGLVHIADVPGRHQPGTGEINYNNIYRKLIKLNYQHYAAMEFLPTGDEVKQLRAAKEEVLAAGA